MYYTCINKLITTNYYFEIFDNERFLVVINPNTIWFLKFRDEDDDCILCNTINEMEWIKISESMLNKFFKLDTTMNDFIR